MLVSTGFQRGHFSQENFDYIPPKNFLPVVSSSLNCQFTHVSSISCQFMCTFIRSNEFSVIYNYRACRILVRMIKYDVLVEETVERRIKMQMKGKKGDGNGRQELS